MCTDIHLKNHYFNPCKTTCRRAQFLTATITLLLMYSTPFTSTFDPFRQNSNNSMINLSLNSVHLSPEELAAIDHGLMSVYGNSNNRDNRDNRDRDNHTNQIFGGEP